MSDYFEIDFLDVETKKSGDAICMRYRVNDHELIHVVDGGYQSTGEKILEHLRKYYDDPDLVHHVVATHPDGDHAGGLRSVLADKRVETLWMLRPWIYADELLARFPSYSSADRLRSRLRALYPNLVALEEIALEQEIPINEPFQGVKIGAFTVMAPARARYLDLIASSERTPEETEEQLAAVGQSSPFYEAVKKVVNLIKAAWGNEYFPSGETSSENEMSVVQYARLCDQKILLTADTGRAGLKEVIDYAPYAGLVLPGINKFQVPHHGGRHNVSTELLDKLLGERLKERSENAHFTAIISSAKEDDDHPRKAVVRAMIHRGAHLVTTEGQTVRTSKNAPDRGWSPIPPHDYPETQED